MLSYIKAIIIILSGALSSIHCNNSSEQTATTTTVTQTTSKASIPPHKGKKLFMDYCARCHHPKMKQDMIGPALYDVEKRWEKESDLIAFIQDAQAMINNNHSRAVKISTLWPSEMPSFEALTKEQIHTILDYIKSIQ